MDRDITDEEPNENLNKATAFLLERTTQFTKAQLIFSQRVTNLMEAMVYDVKESVRILRDVANLTEKRRCNTTEEAEHKAKTMHAHIRQEYDSNGQLIVGCLIDIIQHFTPIMGDEETSEVLRVLAEGAELMELGDERM